MTPHGFIGKQIWFDQMVERADQFLKIVSEEKSNTMLIDSL